MTHPSVLDLELRVLQSETELPRELNEVRKSLQDVSMRNIRRTYVVCFRLVRYKALHPLCLDMSRVGLHFASFVIRGWERADLC